MIWRSKHSNGTIKVAIPLIRTKLTISSFMNFARVLLLEIDQTGSKTRETSFDAQIIKLGIHLSESDRITTSLTKQLQELNDWKEKIQYDWEQIPAAMIEVEDPTVNDQNGPNSTNSAKDTKDVTLIKSMIVKDYQRVVKITIDEKDISFFKQREDSVLKSVSHFFLVIGR